MIFNIGDKVTYIGMIATIKKMYPGINTVIIETEFDDILKVPFDDITRYEEPELEIDRSINITPEEFKDVSLTVSIDMINNALPELREEIAFYCSLITTQLYTELFMDEDSDD